jgi:hypothetical protein
LSAIEKWRVTSGECRKRWHVGRFAGEVLRLAALAQDDYPCRIVSLKVRRFRGAEGVSTRSFAG